MPYKVQSSIWFKDPKEHHELCNTDTMSAAIAAPLLYPAVSEAALKSQYLGTKILDLPTPAAIIDRAVAVRNCTDMLDAARKLGLEFRAHVKTHKVGRQDAVWLFSCCRLRVRRLVRIGMYNGHCLGVSDGLL